MNAIERLENGKQLPRLLVALPAIALGTVLFLWVFIVVVRKWFDRGSTIPGFKPSWWSPMGVEWNLHSTWNLRRMPIGEVLLEFITALTCMFDPNAGILQGFVFIVPAVLVWKANGVEKILGSNKLIHKSLIYTRLESWLGTGLLTSNGNKWRLRRKILTPAFHFRILEDFLPVFNEHSQVFTQILKQHEGLKPVDISPLVTMATLDIICETAMGVKLNAQEDSGTEYVKALYIVGAGFMKRLTKPWLWVDPLYNISAEGRFYNKNTEILHSFTRRTERAIFAFCVCPRGKYIHNKLHRKRK